MSEIEKHFAEICKKDISYIPEEYNLLSKKQKHFLDNLSKYLNCEKLPYLLDKKIYNIFCLSIKNINITLNKFLFRHNNHYCSHAVYDLLYFIDRQYQKYIEINKDINLHALNTKLFGKEKIDDEELLHTILDMTLKDFVIRFSVLCNYDTNQT
ncbi:hypothetical protein [Nitratifractor salsuginis]|nr:hypothetical protein [Nitratifractor salsuginis]